MKPVRIIGLGSPFGDDRIGWLAVEALRKTRWVKDFPGGITLLALDRPGLGLVSALEGAHGVFLVDGIKSGAPPGSLHHLAGSAWAQGESSLSSHDLGVAAAIRMAEAIGQLPEHLILLGIEIENIAEPTVVNRTALRALSRLVSVLRDELYRLHA